MPKSRLDFWQPKLQGNRARDLRYRRELEALGWRILIVWECQIRDREQLENEVRDFLIREDENEDD
jgi:DNA mismatch endonuclease (patch repair protein)